MSKRKLLELVKNNYVSGWDDPRMPTICGIRRRGYTPEAIRNFAERIGVAKRDNVIDFSLLEFFVREDLNKRAERRMAVLNPLKVVITNYPEGQTEELEAVNNPEDAEAGTRMIPFGREIFIERDDFMEVAPKKYFRLAIGQEVRLRYAYFIKATDVVKDADGNIIEVHATYDPASRGGNSPDGRKVQGTIHWVSAEHAKKVDVRLYDRLFTRQDMDNLTEDEDYKDFLNPESLKVVEALVEPDLTTKKPGDKFQFERIGYFCVDSDSTDEKIIFNRTVTLKDSWAKIAGK